MNRYVSLLTDLRILCVQKPLRATSNRVHCGLYVLDELSSEHKSIGHHDTI